MADQQQAESALGAQLGQQLHDGFGGLWVQRGGDFVAQQDIWLGGDGARDGQAPAESGHAVSVSGEGRCRPDRRCGQGEPPRADPRHVVMGIVAVVYLAAPGVVLRPFLDPADSITLGIATSLLMIAALMQFFDCAQNIGVGLLRGVDDTKSGFRLTVIGYWLIGLPAAFLLGLTAGTGPLGVWLGLMCGLAVTAALLLRRFASTLARVSRRLPAANSP